MPLLDSFAQKEFTVLWFIADGRVGQVSTTKVVVTNGCTCGARGQGLVVPVVWPYPKKDSSEMHRMSD